MSRFVFDSVTGLMMPRRATPRLGKRLCSLAGMGAAFFASGAPDDLSSIAMVGRYEAWRETVVADGTAQAQATDWSGNGNNAVQVTGAKQPLYKTNRIATSLPAWRFNGTGQLFQTSSLAAMGNSASRWYYVVCQYLSFPNAANGPFSLVNTGAGNVESMYYVSPVVYRIYDYGPSSTDQISIVAPGTTAFRLYSLVLDGTNVATKMGPTGTFSNSVSQLTPAPNGTASFILGDLISTSAGNGANCDIAAAFIGNSVLSAPDRARIEAYILRIYGVSAG